MVERELTRVGIASNMSGITTTQSKIAEDLDAFAAASWFTSTYLVSSHALGGKTSTKYTVDSNVVDIPSLCSSSTDLLSTLLCVCVLSLLCCWWNRYIDSAISS